MPQTSPFLSTDPAAGTPVTPDASPFLSTDPSAGEPVYVMPAKASDRRKELAAAEARYIDMPRAPEEIGPRTYGHSPVIDPSSTPALQKATGIGPAPPSSFLDRVKDFGVTLQKGALSIPEMLAGLGDIVSKGKVGEFAFGKDGMQRQKEALDVQLTPEQRAANKAVSDASGLMGTLGAALSHSSTIAHNVVESVPLMVASGAIGRALGAATKIGPAVAGAIGEGIAGAGSAAEQTRQETGGLTPAQAALSVSSGAATSIIGIVGGKIAESLGLADIDSLLAGAAKSEKAKRGLFMSLLYGAIQEGGFEELPQSVQEQVQQNWAQGKPWHEGVSQAAVLGALSGAVMGAGAQVLEKSGPAEPRHASAAEPQTPTKPPLAAGDPLLSRTPPDAAAEPTPVRSELRADPAAAEIPQRPAAQPWPPVAKVVAPVEKGTALGEPAPAAAGPSLSGPVVPTAPSTDLPGTSDAEADALAATRSAAEPAGRDSVLPELQEETNWFKQHEAKVQARKETARQLAEAGPQRLQNTEGKTALAGPDPSKPGAFRVTWFDREGEPWGHVEHKTLASAIDEALSEGYAPAEQDTPEQGQRSATEMSVAAPAAATASDVEQESSTPPLSETPTEPTVAAATGPVSEPAPESGPPPAGPGRAEAPLPDHQRPQIFRVINTKTGEARDVQTADASALGRKDVLFELIYGTPRILKTGDQVTPDERRSVVRVPAGWADVTAASPAAPAAPPPQAPAVADVAPPPMGVAGAKPPTVTHNADRGSIEVKFPSAPTKDITSKLQQAGFAWSRPNKAWWKRIDEHDQSASRVAIQAEARGIVGLEPVAADSVAAAAKADQPAASSPVTAKTEESTERRFSSTQFDLPEELADRVRKLAASIPGEDLAEGGREEHPHVTLKYGLHTEDPAGVREALAGEGPIEVVLSETSYFPSSDSTDGDDVLKIDVSQASKQKLAGLNKKVADANEHTDTHPVYKPHVTVARLKPGRGKKYAGKRDLAGRVFRVSSVTFSSKDGTATAIPLVGAAEKPTSGAAPVSGKDTSPSQSAPAAPSPYSKPAMRDAFGLTPQQAEATDALVQAMGLDTSAIAVAKGGQSAPNALAQKNDTAGQTSTPAFRQWFGESKVVSESGDPLVVYHGTKRADRVGSRFRKARATSGPMAFFTSDKQIATNYSTQKSDTSLERPEDYRDWFKFKPKGSRSPVNLQQAWYYLSPDQRAEATRRLYTVGYENRDQAEGPIVPNSSSIMPRDGIEYELRSAKGNALEAAKEIWLNSGSLIDDEEKFLEVLKGMGVEGLYLDDPDAATPKVYEVFLRIERPLDTADIPHDVLKAIERRAGRQRIGAQQYGEDQWDKRTRDAREWVAQLKKDIADGTNSFVWSSIPDWVTDTLKGFGYDGIHDTGGKMGGPGHDVWVPFDDRQVKSATDNRGTFDPSTANILKQDEKGATEFAEDGKAIVRAFGSADVSTAIHEIAHVARRQLLNRVVPAEQRRGVSDADIVTAEAWAGASDGQWTVAAEEKLARGFERYLRDGQAPNASLRAVFERFQEWLTDIYARIRGSAIDVRISPAMQEVFDRLVTRSDRLSKEGDAASAETTVHDRRELKRILAELESVPFAKHTFNEGGRGRGGEIDIVPGSAGAPVFDDILQSAPGTSSYTRGQVIAAVRKFLDGGPVTNPVRGALSVARARAEGKSRTEGGHRLSKPMLPVEAGDEPGRIYVRRMTSLSPELSAAQDRFAAAVEADPEGFVRRYRERFGKIVGADNAKELFDAYAASPESRTQLDLAVHRPASAVAHKVLDEMIAEGAQGFAPEREYHNVVVFTAGGTGAGKTTATSHVLGPLMDAARIVYDSTLTDLPGAERDIAKAMGAGFDVAVVLTERDIDDAFKATLERTAGYGRPVTINTHIRTHAAAGQNVQRLRERFGNDVTFFVLRNTRDAGQELVPLEDWRPQEYDQADVRARLETILEGAHRAGQASDALREAVRPKQGGAGRTDAPGDTGRGRTDRADARVGDPVGSPAEDARVATPSPSVDILDTGEAQPRLPEAGAVRDQNISTPTFEAPFSLTGAADTTPTGVDQDLFSAPAETPASEPTQSPGKVLSAIDRAEQAAKDRLKKRGTLGGGRLSAGLPVDDIADLVVIGTAKIARGVIQFGQWSAQMIAEFGEMIRPHLADLYRQAQERSTRVADVQADDYFNFKRVDVSDAERQALRDEVIETVLRTGRSPKEKTTFADIKRDAEDLHPDVTKLLAPFQEAQAPYRAVRFAARQRINTLNRSIVERRKGMATLVGEDLILAETALQKDEQDLRGLLDVWMRLRSEDGRNLAMHRMMADSTWDLGFWMLRAKRALGLPPSVDLPDDVQIELQDILAKGDEAEQSGQDTRRIRDDLARRVAKLEKQTFWEILTTLRKAGLLTGIKTHLRNLGGNASFQVLEELARMPAVVVDVALSTATHRRTVQGVSPRSLARASYEAATKGLREAADIVRTGTRVSDYEKVGVTRELNSGMPWLDAYANFVFRTLSAEDRVFRSYAYRRSIEEQAQLEAIARGITPAEVMVLPPPSMLARAIADAEFATFNNPNIGATALRMTQGQLRRTGGAGRAVSFAIDMMIPFANTPANLIARMIDYTPVGGAVRASIAVGRAMSEKALTPAQQRAIALAIGRGTTGGAIVWLGWALANAGLANGMGGDDEGERNVDQAAGRLPGSVLIDGRWRQVAPFSPLGNLVTLGASMQETATKPLAEEARRAGKMVALGTKIALEQPMLQGINDLISALRYPESSGERAVGSMVGSFVPTLASDTAALFDPYLREARPDGFSESLWMGAESRLPGLRQLLPKRFDVLGRPIEQSKMPLWDPTIGTAAKELSDPVLRELVAHRVRVGWPRKKPGESSDLYRARTVQVGKMIDRQLNAVVGSSRYSQLTDAQKVDSLEDAVEIARRSVAGRPPLSSPDLDEDTRRRATESGHTIARAGR